MSDFSDLYFQLRDQGRSPEDAYAEARRRGARPSVLDQVAPETTDVTATPASAPLVKSPTMQAQTPRTHALPAAEPLPEPEPDRTLPQQALYLATRPVAGAIKGAAGLAAVPLEGAGVITSAARESLFPSSDAPIKERLRESIAANPLTRAGKAVSGVGEDLANDVFGKTTGAPGHVLEAGGMLAVPGGGAGKAEEVAAGAERTAKAAREYLNTPTFRHLTDEGKSLLDDLVLRTAARAERIPKERVPWAQVQAEGDALLQQAPERLYSLTPAQIGGKEAYAIKSLVQSKVDALAEVNAKLLAATDPAEIGNLTRQATALEAESSQLLDKLMKGTSQQARDLNANKIMAGLTNDPVTWLLKATRTAGRPLTDTERSTILGYLRDGDRAEMLRFVGGLHPTTPLGKAVTAWKAGLLTNPSTHAANLSGNTTFAVAEHLAQAPAAAADWFMGLASKQRTKALPSVRQAGETLRGAREGLADVPAILKGLPVGDEVTLGIIPRETQFGNGIATAFVNGPFRFLNAEDRVFSAAAFRGSLAEQASVLAKLEKQTGPAFRNRVAELIQQPTDEMALRASEDALVRTFRDKTPVGEALSAVQRNLGTAGQVILPFTRTPAAVGTRLGEYTPYGLGKGSLKATQAILAIRKALKASAPVTPELKRMQQVAAETLGRGTIGTGLMAAGYYLYRNGAYSGARPASDPSLAETKQAAGIPDDAFRIGHAYLEPNRIGIPAMLMTLGAAMGEAADAGEDAGPSAKLGQAMSSFVRILTDQPFLRGVADIQKIVEDPGAAASAYGRNLAGSAVPAIVAAAARATDPTLRDARTVGEVLRSRLPGQSNDLPARRDFLGDPLPRQGQGVLNNALLPFRVSHDRLQDPVLRSVVTSGATVSRLRKLPEESAADYSARSEEVGHRIRGVLEGIMAQPGFTALPAEQQSRMVERAVSALRGGASRERQALRYQALRNQGLSAEEAYRQLRAEMQSSTRVGTLLSGPRP